MQTVLQRLQPDLDELKQIWIPRVKMAVSAAEYSAMQSQAPTHVAGVETQARVRGPGQRGDRSRSMTYDSASDDGEDGTSGAGMACDVQPCGLTAYQVAWIMQIICREQQQVVHACAPTRAPLLLAYYPCAHLYHQQR